MPQQQQLEESLPNGSADINDNFRLGEEEIESLHHIYENLPAESASSRKSHPIPELRKYFPREAIYENLCRGCGYGVFAAQGRYCHFCQCIVSGGVVRTQPTSPPPPPPPLLKDSQRESNIYENICEVCRGIYSDNEKCECQREGGDTSTPTSTTPSAPPTPPTTGKSKSRTLLNYSKSSAATLTRLFGSLKQLNRTASLQRRIFQREVPKEREKVRAPAGGSLEIIHNVDEVFRTQETFDMQRICELKSQLQSSQSDQHIYGRVREPEREQRKKPRISRMRLLQIEQEHDLDQDQDQESGEVASLYLNESVCQWMTSLRSQVHHYDEGAWQQPKSVPASYQREREWMQQDEEEEKENVILRRTKEDQEKLDPVDNFKRKLRLKREPKERPEEQRRCAVTPDLVSEFLSNLQEDKKEREELEIARVLPPTATIHSLWQLMQAIVFSSSLHVCVRGFLTSYDKSLAQWLFLQQQQQQQHRRRRHHSAIAMRAYLKRAGKRASAKRVVCDRESAGEEMVLWLVAPPTPESDDVSAELRRRKRSEEIGVKTETGPEVAGPVIESDNSGGVKKNNNSEDSRSDSNKKNNSVDGGRALMAAPKTNGEAERPNSNNNHNNNNANSSNTNNNNNNNDNESTSGSSNNNNNNTGNCNVSEQQQQQQQITQNCVIKVRRPAPKVPVRNPTTALSTPRQAEESSPKAMDSPGRTHEHLDQEDPEEESIYQPIWKFKTLEPDQDIIQSQTLDEEDEDDEDEDDEDEEDELELVEDYDESLPSDGDADVMALQAAAVFAAGVRHKVSTSTLTKRSKLMLPTPLPSPTASMDQGAWETDVEFMYSREAEAEAEADMDAEADETLSLGSTVTNSTATLGSISSRGSAAAPGPAPPAPPLLQEAPKIVPLVHDILRNICIFYSPREPMKYSAIFYDYQRSYVHQRFMTRIRRPAPPPPPLLVAPQPPPAAHRPAPHTDDSGCSCEAEDQEENHNRSPRIPPSIPKPLKEEWERAVLAAGALGGKRGVAPRAGRKLRVRSNARLLLTDSVLAWREQLQDVNCCEDEEDMIVPVTDILRAQQIQEDNEVQQSQQSTILQRFKSVSIGNLLDLPGEDDKKSIKNRMRMKFAVNSNVFRINRSPKSEKKSRQRRGQVTSLYLDEQQKYPLFSAPLNALELNMTDHPNVPRFVVDVCAYIERPECIEQDGLYRASGNKVLVDELKKKLTHIYDPRWLQTDDIHTLTSLHKQFFRELAAPLITQEAYDRLGRNLSDDAAIERMRIAFDDMPEPNRSTLRFLIQHLTRVAAASGSNRMPSTNLAIVWGPCLLSANQIQLDIGRMNMLAKVLIENYDRIFQPDNERLVC
ncbi:hypothetical protein KR067_005990 [Drosophila pandora]|nr:hypothetical protein KR067_005990 [Drosophila pandora]